MRGHTLNLGFIVVWAILLYLNQERWRDGR